MILRIRKSIKIKNMINYTFDSFRFAIDLILVFYSAIKNIVLYRKLYKEDLTIVTATDQIFFESLIQLLENIRYYEKEIPIVVYNLGIEESQYRTLLDKKFNNLNIKDFDFSSFPNFYSERDKFNRLGQYAWKSAIINKELISSKKQVLWFDTGNLITKKVTLVRIIVSALGVFSPISAGSIINWTHKDTLNYLNTEKSIYKKRNLTGGIVAFDWENQNARNLSKDWKDYCSVEKCIAPKGSNRDNHRQDQSILSILKYKNKKISTLPRLKKTFGLLVNQNPGRKVYLSEALEGDLLDNFRKEWYKNNFEFSVNTIKMADLIWVIDIKNINKVQKKFLNVADVIVSLTVNDLKNRDYLNKELSIYEKYIDYYLVHDIEYSDFESNDFKQLNKVIKFNENSIRGIVIKLLNKN
tara:strand:- start:997 stop:2232 length:1236 start_codon:yes stop_codon:yes gene_type:complete